jgi:hypothetical protein
MARLPRYQESGLISADIPRLDFAASRESAGLSQAITSSLDKITEFALGKVKAEQEMKNNILGIQMRGDFESDVQKRFAELNLELNKGDLKPTDFSRIQEEVKALSGYAVELAKISPQQANGLMNSINTGGKALLAKAGDVLTKTYAVEANQKTDKTIEDTQYNLEMAYRYSDSLETIEKYEAQARAVVFASATNNPDTLQEKMERFEKARISARQSAIRDYINKSKDPILTYQQIKAGRSEDPVINEMMRSGQRNTVLDAADAAMKDYNLTVDNISKFNAERAKEIEVSWADAIRSDNQDVIKKVLSDTRMYDPSNYEKRLDQYDNTRGIFAIKDNQLLVKNLDERFADPYGSNPVTISELIKNSTQLTQPTYSKYLDRVKVYLDDRAKILRDQVSSELGTSIGSALMPDAQRKRAQAQLNAFDVALITARRENPNIDVFQWYEKNKDNILKTSGKKADTDLVTKVTGRAIKTEKGFTNAIRDAQRIGDVNAANDLQFQYQEWRDARKLNLIDDNGNKIGAAQ